MNAGATLAEKPVRILLQSAAPGAKMDYSILTTEIGKAVRDHPEGGDMIIKLPPPQTVTYRRSSRRPSVPHHLRHREIDFFLALNAAGKISAMYYHPAVDVPS